MLRLLLLMLTLAMSVDEWQLTDTQNLREVIGNRSNGVLSPDGSMIAWTQSNQLCLYTLADETQACFTPFEDIPLAAPVWSPDGQRIAFTESLRGVEGAPGSSFYLVYESDVWVFDVARQTFVNLTDDGFSGIWNSEVDGVINTAIGLDIAPTWNPATGDLLFFSILQNTLVLYKLVDDTPQQLFIVSFDLAFSLGLTPFDRLDRLSAVFSPDGSQIAITWLPAEGDWGIFLLDAANPARWTHLVTADDFRAGLPEWSEVGIVPYHVEWAHDGLLISAFGEGFEDQESSMPAMAYFVTLPDGEVQPLLDLTDVSEMLQMQHPDESGLTPIAQLPRAAVVAPDGVSAFYVSYDFSGEAHVWAIALPPAGETRLLLGEISDFDCCFIGRALSSANARMLTYGFLLTFER